MSEDHEAELEDLNNQISTYYAQEMKLKQEVVSLTNENEQN